MIEKIHTVEKYWKAGKSYLEYSGHKFAEVRQRLPESVRPYFDSTLADPAVQAFSEVMGQTTLIDMHICGVVDEYDDRALEAAFNVGSAFYEIKLVDEITEKAKDIKSGLLNFFKDVMMGQNPQSQNFGIFSEEVGNVESIINTIGLEYSPFAGVLFEHARHCEKVKWNNISDYQRIMNSERIGEIFGELMYDIISEHYPETQKWAYDFMKEQGKCANLYDDLKDRHLDRKHGYGYSNEGLALLGLHFAASFVKLPIQTKRKAFLETICFFYGACIKIPA